MSRTCGDCFGNSSTEECRCNSGGMDRFTYEPLKCKYCNKVSQSIPNGPYIWCCKEAKEDNEIKIDTIEIARLQSRGYTVTKVKKKRCPHCNLGDIILFTADEDWCKTCSRAIPGT